MMSARKPGKVLPFSSFQAPQHAEHVSDRGLSSSCGSAKLSRMGLVLTDRRKVACRMIRWRIGGN